MKIKRNFNVYQKNIYMKVVVGVVWLSPSPTFWFHCPTLKTDATMLGKCQHTCLYLRYYLSLTWFSLLLRVDSTTPGGAGRESDGGPPTDRAWCGSQQTRCRLLDPSPRSLRGGSRRYYKVQLPPTSFVTLHYVITWDHGLNMFSAPLACPTRRIHGVFRGWNHKTEGLACTVYDLCDCVTS